jgi:hypothetical protein
MKTFRKLVNETQAALVTMGPPRKKLNHAKYIKLAKAAMHSTIEMADRNMRKEPLRKESLTLSRNA